MKTQQSAFLQSRFYNAALNSAIYDGPVRIYFNQLHETHALKLYFSLQNDLKADLAKAKDLAKALGRVLIVVLYPHFDMALTVLEQDIEEMKIDKNWFNQRISIYDCDGDAVLPLLEPLSDKDLQVFHHKTKSVFQTWQIEFNQFKQKEAQL